MAGVTMAWSVPHSPQKYPSSKHVCERRSSAAITVKRAQSQSCIGSSSAGSKPSSITFTATSPT